MRVGNEDAGPVEHVDEPFNDGVRPVRGRREWLADGAAGELQVAQDRLDVGLWCGGRNAWTTDFRHCGDLGQVMRGDGREEWTHDEESVDELNGDTLAAVFFGEGAAPGCEECFAAGVGRQHGRGNFARKGTNVQDQTVLPERETKLNNKRPGKK
jgi:hypothetical protein